MIRAEVGEDEVAKLRVPERSNTYRLDPAWLAVEPATGRLSLPPLKPNQALLHYLTVPDQPNFRIRLIAQFDTSVPTNSQVFEPDPGRRSLIARIPETIPTLRTPEKKLRRVEIIREGQLFLARSAEMFTEESSATPSIDELEWADVLKSVFAPENAAAEPMEEGRRFQGTPIGRATRLWPSYSFRNRLYLLSQFRARGLEAEPVRTFNGWKKENRSVRKGARAFNLVVPVRSFSSSDAASQETRPEDDMHGFAVKKMVFSYSQTKPRGKKAENKHADAYIPPALPSFDPELALAALNIEAKVISETEQFMREMPTFVGGYSQGRTIFLRAMDQAVWSTMFHEMAHIMLGHTHQAYDYKTNRAVAELEAESVAMLCLMSLDIQGIEEKIAYILGWFKGDEYPEAAAKRVIATARKILEAGGVKAPREGQEDD